MSMYSTSDGSTKSSKRKKLRCVGLTEDIDQINEENLPNKYELDDIKDSCRIEYNGLFYEVNSKQLKILYKLGEGNFGEVHLVQLENNPNVIFATKRMTLVDHGQNNYSSQSDLKAMRVVGNDRYPHIVHFYGVFINNIDGQLIICMEALQTSLDKLYPILHSKFNPTPILLDLIITRLAKHMVLALDYLKSKNLIHRDVKPQNMLVGKDIIYKLCDFGICGTLTDSVSSTHLGSMRYLPPERIGSVGSYGTRSDMWALGMSLLEISQGYLPLASESIMSFMSHMKNGWQPDVPLTLSEDTRYLLSLLLRHDVTERPRYYSDILSMPSMINVKANPSEEEIHLVHSVLDALPPKTPE